MLIFYFIFYGLPQFINNPPPKEEVSTKQKRFFSLSSCYSPTQDFIKVTLLNIIDCIYLQLTGPDPVGSIVPLSFIQAGGDHGLAYMVKDPPAAAIAQSQEVVVTGHPICGRQWVMFVPLFLL